jgi:muconate cycloisomerase
VKAETTGQLTAQEGTPRADRGEAQLREYAGRRLPDNPFENYVRMREAQVDPPAMAALDIAYWDLLAKRAGMPLYRMLGLPRRGVPTSVTIGINAPEVTRERVPKILGATGAKCLKIKLGSPEGRDHDRAHFEAAAEAARPFGAKLRVDANGGWTVDEAIDMNRWLADRGVDYVEQPLPEGQEDDLPRVFEHRPLPILVDESVRFAPDVLKVHDCVDGINLKLMKCGGITEALRIVATAKAAGLATMIGCMSESSVAIAAGASIGALFDYIDLDSHLNLNPDPAEGAPICDGVVLPNDVPGHGARLKP